MAAGPILEINIKGFFVFRACLAGTLYFCGKVVPVILFMCVKSESMLQRGSCCHKVLRRGINAEKVNEKKVTVSKVHLYVKFYAAPKFDGVHAGQNPINSFTNENKKFKIIFKQEEGDGRGGIFVIEMV
jgi:hypothetical protein